MIILSTKLKNKFPVEFDVQLKNITINGDKRGCSGFISYNDKTVYLTTEPLGTMGMMYRTAKNSKDYSGGANQWAKGIDNLVSAIIKMLTV
jgi:hypothetical protein